MTVVGPGGIGKTRLVAELARRVERATSSRAWFVELADVSGVDDLAELVAAAMRTSAGASGDAIDRVVEALGDGPTLLVLDNCEHVTSATADFVRALVDRSNGARVVATSRMALGLTGEVEVRLSPLPVPVDWTTPDELMQSPSVALYVDRVVARRPDFALTARNAAAVARLCAKLEGIPLALELAAGRERVLPAAQLVARLEHRFDVLASSQRDVPERHRTLSAAIGWSFDALDEESRRVFSRLSVFRGEWTLEHAEAICGSPDTVEAISRMCDVSLVDADEAGDERRFRMLETIREFAAGQLDADERASVERLHAATFLALAERARVALDGPEQTVWFERLDADVENVRAAIDRLFRSGESESAVRIVVALMRYWTARSRTREPRRWLRAALENGDALPSRLHARALWTAGEMEARDSNDAVAEPLLQKAVALFEAQGDERSAFSALRFLGMIAARRKEFDVVREQWGRGLEIAERLGDPGLLATASSTMGILSALLGRYDDALGHYARSVAMFREVGDAWSLMVGLNNIGYTAILGGELDRAGDALRESLETSRARGFRDAELDALVFSALLAWRRGDCAETVRDAAEAVRLGVELGRERRLVWALDVVAFASADLGRDEVAARLLGAADALRESTRATPTLDDPSLRDRYLVALRERLGEAEVTRLLGDGADAELESLLP